MDDDYTIVVWYVYPIYVKAFFIEDKKIVESVLLVLPFNITKKVAIFDSFSRGFHIDYFTPCSTLDKHEKWVRMHVYVLAIHAH